MQNIFYITNNYFFLHNTNVFVPNDAILENCFTLECDAFDVVLAITFCMTCIKMLLKSTYAQYQWYIVLLQLNRIMIMSIILKYNVNVVV